MSLKHIYSYINILRMLMVACLATACGGAEPWIVQMPSELMGAPQDHEHEFLIENHSNEDLHLTLDAWGRMYCLSGTPRQIIIPPNTVKTLKAEYKHCTSDAGSRIAFVSIQSKSTVGFLQDPVSGTRIVCSGDQGKSLTVFPPHS